MAALTQSQHRRALRCLLPAGSFWAVADGDDLDTLLNHWADFGADFDARLDALLLEADPRTATDLDAWEAELGITPTYTVSQVMTLPVHQICMPVTKTRSERVNEILWSLGQGGALDLAALASTYGLTYISFTPLFPSVPSLPLRCGEALANPSLLNCYQLSTEGGADQQSVQAFEQAVKSRLPANYILRFTYH